MSSAPAKDRPVSVGDKIAPGMRLVKIGHAPDGHIVWDVRIAWWRLGWEILRHEVRHGGKR